MTEPSAGEWSDVIGRGLERFKAKMDLGIGPREFTFGQTRALGLPLIHAGTSAVGGGPNLGKQFQVRGMLPDEKGNLGDVIARTRHDTSDPRLIRDTLGMVSGYPYPREGLYEDWRTIISGGDTNSWHHFDHLDARRNFSQSEFWGDRAAWGRDPTGSNNPQQSAWFAQPEPTLPSEEMYHAMKKADEAFPPTQEDIAGNRERIHNRRIRSHGLSNQEMPVMASGRRGAFHAGTGVFRFVED